MATQAERIEQFRKMAEADPDNELGHFSLGRAYLDSNQFELAVASLRRALQINPNLSKAYQLLADALLKENQKDAAITALTDGVKIADARGDVLPKREMIASLQQLGAAIPELSSNNAVVEQVGEGQVLCKRCGQVKPHLARPPFKNEFGQKIFESICTSCWREAIGMGTKVINELRLPMADPQAQRIWDQHIREFLGL
jgi:Fe-S cluster biosynthesis and repair protein YggX